MIIICFSCWNVSPASADAHRPPPCAQHPADRPLQVANIREISSKQINWNSGLYEVPSTLPRFSHTFSPFSLMRETFTVEKLNLQEGVYFVQGPIAKLRIKTKSFQF